MSNSKEMTHSVFGMYTVSAFRHIQNINKKMCFIAIYCCFGMLDRVKLNPILEQRGFPRYFIYESINPFSYEYLMVQQ